MVFVISICSPLEKYFLNQNRRKHTINIVKSIISFIFWKNKLFFSRQIFSNNCLTIKYWFAWVFLSCSTWTLVQGIFYQLNLVLGHHVVKINKEKYKSKFSIKISELLKVIYKKYENIFILMNVKIGAFFMKYLQYLFKKS